MRGKVFTGFLVAALLSFGLVPPAVVAQDDRTEELAASANLRHTVARLTGANEVPANNSTGTGYARVVLNDAENQITVSVTWQGLSSNTISGHIHGNAAPGVNAPILFDLQPPTGATSGSVTNKTFAVTAQNVADMRAGLWYVNIHSTNFTGGEIRGQLVAQKQPADYNGDGLTDYAVGRAVSGQISWFVMYNGQTATNFGFPWGNPSTDIIIPNADFDGDGKTDVTVWRPGATTAGFYSVLSSNNTPRYTQFGQTGDIPIVGDYDGDGKDDVAIYRAASASGGQSYFWFSPSSGPLQGRQIAVPWGTAGDLPIPGDFNGDGKNDYMVERANGSGALFFMRPSNGGIPTTDTSADVAFSFGLFADTAVPGDYDGDGITDIAVIRVQNGSMSWFIRPTASGGAFYGTTWGIDIDPDFPVQGDYDGDGKTDIGIWRLTSPSTFFILPTTGGFIYRPYGLSNDQPINFGIPIGHPV